MDSFRFPYRNPNNNKPQLKAVEKYFHRLQEEGIVGDYEVIDNVVGFCEALYHVLDMSRIDRSRIGLWAQFSRDTVHQEA